MRHFVQLYKIQKHHKLIKFCMGSQTIYLFDRVVHGMKG